MEKREHATNPAVADVLALLSYYRFEFGERTPTRTISDWLETYPANWVRLAIVEALYQGRYKAVSVTQILGVWQRREQPYPHFNYEFESLVCRHVQMPVKTNNTPRHGNSSSGTQEPSEEEPDKLNPRVEGEKPLMQEEAGSEELNSSDDISSNVKPEGDTQPRKTPTSIDRFSPTVDGSGFYIRLKTIAEKSQSEDENRPQEQED